MYYTILNDFNTVVFWDLDTSAIICIRCHPALVTRLEPTSHWINNTFTTWELLLNGHIKAIVVCKIQISISAKYFLSQIFSVQWLVKQSWHWIVLSVLLRLKSWQFRCWYFYEGLLLSSVHRRVTWDTSYKYPGKVRHQQ